MMLLSNQHYPINVLYAVLGLPRGSTRYRPRPSEDRRVRGDLVKLAGKRPTEADRRVTVRLKWQDHAVNHHRVRRRRRARGIAGESPRRKPRSMDRDHASLRFPNLGEGLKRTRPDQMWVVNIVDIRLRSEFIALSLKRDSLT